MHQVVLEEPYRRLVISYLNLVLGDSPKSDGMNAMLLSLLVVTIVYTCACLIEQCMYRDM